MRGEPPHKSSFSPYVRVIAIRPYYNKHCKTRIDQKCHFIKLTKWSKMMKCEMHKMWKCQSHDHFLPLRNGGVDFGLKTGSRGTPWNSKSAQPGGSENANCRFCPFKWHFGLFQGGSIFDTFFVTFSGFTFCWFLMILIFSLFWFSHFSDFLVFVTFWHFVDFTKNTIFYSFSSFFNFENSRVKIRPSFDLFLAPASTPMASTWWCSILNGKILSLFLSLFHDFGWFLSDFCRFFSFAIKKSLFLINFHHFFDINFWSIL